MLWLNSAEWLAVSRLECPASSCYAAKISHKLERRLVARVIGMGRCHPSDCGLTLLLHSCASLRSVQSRRYNVSMVLIAAMHACWSIGRIIRWEGGYGMPNCKYWLSGIADGGGQRPSWLHMLLAPEGACSFRLLERLQLLLLHYTIASSR